MPNTSHAAADSMMITSSCSARTIHVHDPHPDNFKGSPGDKEVAPLPTLPREVQENIIDQALPPATTFSFDLREETGDALLRIRHRGWRSRVERLVAEAKWIDLHTTAHRQDSSPGDQDGSDPVDEDERETEARIAQHDDATSSTSDDPANVHSSYTAATESVTTDSERRSEARVGTGKDRLPTAVRPAAASTLLVIAEPRAGLGSFAGLNAVIGEEGRHATELVLGFVLARCSAACDEKGAFR